LFGIGFDILFGYTGLLSFGQSAFYGTGGFIAAYLLTRAGFPNVTLALIIGMVVAAIVGYLVGLIALRRTGIYFAMITGGHRRGLLFRRVQSTFGMDGGENGLPGVPTPSLDLGFTTLHFTSGWSLYPFLACCYFIGIVIGLRIVRSPVGAVFMAIRENPLRAAAVGHSVHAYKLAAFVIAAAYAGLAGGLLGVLQAFMPPEAFTFETSGQLVMQTAIGGRGTLFGPLVGAAVWLFLQDFLQATLKLGASWKLVLGRDLRASRVLPAPGHYWRTAGSLRLSERAKASPVALGESLPSSDGVDTDGTSANSVQERSRLHALSMPARHHANVDFAGPILQATGSANVTAVSSPTPTSTSRSIRANCAASSGRTGAGKTTFFKMLTCEVPPTSGKIVFEGRDITGMSITDVCQLGLTKSYQVNQLFNRLTSAKM
jgi:branched-chain amino acid transport system permease protein